MVVFTVLNLIYADFNLKKIFIAFRQDDFQYSITFSTV